MCDLSLGYYWSSSESFHSQLAHPHIGFCGGHGLLCLYKGWQRHWLWSQPFNMVLLLCESMLIHQSLQKFLLFPLGLLELQVSILAQHADSFLTNLFMTRLCFSSPSWFCSFLLLFWFLFIAHLLFPDIFALVEVSLFRHELSIQPTALVAFSNTQQC